MIILLSWNRNFNDITLGKEIARGCTARVPRIGQGRDHNHGQRNSPPKIATDFESYSPALKVRWTVELAISERRSNGVGSRETAIVGSLYVVKQKIQKYHHLASPTLLPNSVKGEVEKDRNPPSTTLVSPNEDDANELTYSSNPPLSPKCPSGALKTLWQLTLALQIAHDLPHPGPCRLLVGRTHQAQLQHHQNLIPIKPTTFHPRVHHTHNPPFLPLAPHMFGQYEILGPGFTLNGPTPTYNL
ncbi:4-hydroxythreonine-4-phosphate dehydrogenase [Striga asiatica]|uniref:4-hydroxythreonine-4-phosphate dehydrogenase n=1 Tax=Striga asiatica TaxID=4170 RepID=A0A5A7PZI4_STRAF|nr:4-hydroxythreonine-4-phosphate dehydrogenase [Striga asiatica]